MSTRQINSRSIAAVILGKWLKEGSFPDRLLQPGVPDQPFVTEVVYGGVKWKRLLLSIVGRCSDGKPQPAVIPYLFAGLYQLFFMDNVPPFAAVNETVEAAKNVSTRAANYVNGLLRRALREKDAILKEIENSPLAVRQSHPDILINRWLKRFGPERTARLCKWNNDRAEVVIHPNFSKITLEGLLSLFRSSGAEAAPHPFKPDAFISIPRGFAVPELPGFNEGLFSAQDPSTMSAIDLLDPRPGNAVLDACAAPGGKTILIAERMKLQGRMVAVDVYDDRLALLRENLARMGLPQVEITKTDVSSKAETLSLGENSFDRILLDVPCSNTGVLRRRPDARWRFSLPRLQKVKRLQNLLLDNVSCLLKTGGVLVYSTCSIEPEEGEMLVNKWLAGRDGFKLTKTVSLFPPDTQTDGVFAASLQKTC